MGVLNMKHAFFKEIQEVIKTPYLSNRAAWLFHAKRQFKNNGVTLVELMVTLGIFILLIAIMYPAFSYLQNHISYSNDMQVLNNNGQRILDYIAEDIRMAGFLVGPDARIPVCMTQPPNNPNVLAHNRNGAFDSLSLITAIPVELHTSSRCMNSQTDCAGNNRIDYALTTKCDAASGSLTITVDAADDCFDNIIVPASGINNAKSIITFESLAPIAAAVSGEVPKVYYIVSGTGKTTLTLTESLAQRIPDNSTVFAVRQYTYDVQNRTLRRSGLNKDCNNTGEVAKLIETNSLNTDSGGIDGLRFEFIYEKPLSGTPSFTCVDLPNGNLISCTTIPSTNAGDWSLLPLRNLKAVRIWILLRSDKPDRNYKNTEKYVLGNAEQLTLGPYNDNYRRLLITRTVEVKNLAYRAE